ncbi:helix-turn-helix domain-containing protein [Agrococcus sp. SGAir0287]|uniref:helix-turn-helix domain-containing protein n=1 Tax=Agrococcus sp. SGAir0287 TaxID=2070347 RepID=UPI0010CD3390|nr:XRE family transcriptional regulator [Agrococcus sp. SGAir0287]QCR19541.1 XRE family transcriptional regulator [Agrococcus sp. SGAir0287]
MGALEQVGPRLRAARQARGWTLDELAGRARMSPSTLSRLESGKRQASLELLLPLTTELGIRVDDLLVREQPDPRVRRPVVHRDGMVVAPLSRERSKVQALKVTFLPEHERGEPRVHEGYEWLYVLSGRLRLVLGDRELVLTRGEAAEFDTSVPHSLSAVGSRPVEVLSIFDETGARMQTHTAAPVG